MNFKKIKRLNIFLLLTLLFLVNILTGCEPTMSCLSKSNYMKCSYQELNETKSTQENGKELQVKKGQLVEINYNVIINSGDLQIDIINKDYKLNIKTPVFNAHSSMNKIIWSTSINKNSHEIIKIPIENDGALSINMTGNKANGSFELKWQ
ncbi:MAG: hypothetical protein JWM44_3552 [Bacilli bacterium]|nr:hypothetical protein [Bacilli bacterium]